MAGSKQFWTVTGVYADNYQPYNAFVEAKTGADAFTKALRTADAPIHIGGVYAGKVESVDLGEMHNVVPIRGKTHTIDVHAVVITPHKFALPARCPGCKSNTRHAGSLVEVNLQYRYWSAHLSYNERELSHARGGKSTDGDLIETCAIRCAKCGHMIWDGIHGDQ